jgi:hypothetical protein
VCARARTDLGQIRGTVLVVSVGRAECFFVDVTGGATSRARRRAKVSSILVEGCF